MMNELPDNWQWIKLNDVAEINPKIPNKENMSDDLEVQFLPMKLVEELTGKIHLAETKTYREVKKGYTHFINGDVIFAKVTPCMENGKIAVVENLRNGIGFGSSEFHVIRSKNRLLNKYGFYFLMQQKFRSDAEHAMTGAVGLRRVPKQFLENSQLPIPPIDVQNKIVSKIEELFNELDKGIEELETAQQQLKVYRQAVLKWAFEGKLTNENVKDGELPKGWKWVKLGAQAFITKLAGFEFTKFVRYKDGGDIPVIRAQNVSKDGFIERNFIYVDREIMEKLPRSRIYGGEILMVFVGAGLGNVGIVPSNKEYFLGPNVAKIQLNESYLNKFIYYFLSSTLGFGNVFGKSKATAQGSISMGNIREVIVPFVPLEEQQKIIQEIESRLSVCDKIEETITESLKQAEALRQSILKKAFEGTLLPYHPKI